MDVIVDNSWFGISREEYERIRKRFDSFGNRDAALLVLRAIPVIPFSVVTVIAGAYKYDTRRYLVFTFLGSFIRNSVLGLAGYLAGEGIFAITKNFENYELAGTMLFVIGIVWGYVFYRIIEKRAGG